MKKKITAFVLAAALALTLLPATAFAAPDPISYLDCDANGQNWQTQTIYLSAITEVTSSTTTLDGNINGGWYYVEGNVSTGTLAVTGDVHLILLNGCDLTVNGTPGSAGIQVATGNSLTIYAQSTDAGTMGKLNATGGVGGAGIGGGGSYYSGGGAGNVTISGGVITNAQGGIGSTGGGGAGIGGGGAAIGGGAGTVYINGGVITNAQGGTGSSDGANVGDGGGNITGTELDFLYISAQTYTATVTQGSISGSLSVNAAVNGSTPVVQAGYQWYSNAINSNTNGSPESGTGATAADFDIPTNLTAGTYYYYCEVDGSTSSLNTVTSNVVVVTVTAASAPPSGYTGSYSGGSAPSTPSSAFTGGSVYTKGSGKNLVHTTQKAFSGFNNIRVDSQVLKKDKQFKVENGSTVVTLFADYLETLDIGEHKLEVYFNDGTIATNSFTVEAVGRDALGAPLYSVLKPTHPAGAKVSAQASSNTLILNGKETSFPAVIIDGYNYLKLRDIAALLNKTRKQFNITYNTELNKILINSGIEYSAIGNELSGGLNGNLTAITTTQRFVLDNKTVSISAYNIDGYNYFRLRDIAILLNFGVDFSGGTVRLDLTADYAE